MVSVMADRRTYSLDIEGRIVVCLSERRPETARFNRLPRTPYPYMTTLAGGRNYCYVEVAY